MGKRLTLLSLWMKAYMVYQDKHHYCILIAYKSRKKLYVDNYMYVVFNNTQHNTVHTVTLVTFKLDVYTVYARHSTKIHFPPHSFARFIASYRIRPRTYCWVSINCVTSAVFVIIIIIGLWLGGNLVVG